MSEANVGKCRIFAAGGGGSNIVAQLMKSDRMPNQASFHPVYIDTSRSNLKDGIDESNSYILKDLDGSGMLRRENYAAINNVVKEILHQHKPMDFNLVVFSASGGSGSVIAPLIISELLARDEPVIAVVIGGDESAIATQNSLNTLKSLDGISSTQGKSIVTFYRQNQRGQSRSLTDNEVIMAINAIGIMVSRQIQELDSQDIFNFINYPRVTAHAPAVAGLVITGNELQPMEASKPVSVISIRKSPDEPSIEHIPGFMKASYAEINAFGNSALFFGVDINEPSLWVAALQATLDQINQAADSRPVAARLSGANDAKTDKGIVL